MQFLVKALLGLKVALLGIVLPLGVIVAKVLSWKAVTLSLMAFMLAKIVFVKNLFMGKIFLSFFFFFCGRILPLKSIDR